MATLGYSYGIGEIDSMKALIADTAKAWSVGGGEGIDAVTIVGGEGKASIQGSTLYIDTGDNFDSSTFITGASVTGAQASVKANTLFIEVPTVETSTFITKATINAGSVTISGNTLGIDIPTDTTVSGVTDVSVVAGDILASVDSSTLFIEGTSGGKADLVVNGVTVDAIQFDNADVKVVNNIAYVRMIPGGVDKDAVPGNIWTKTTKAILTPDGKFDTGFLLDGDNTLTKPISLDLTNGLTIELWFSLYSFNRCTLYMNSDRSQASTTPCIIICQSDSTGKILNCHCGDFSHFLTIDITDLVLNTWHHVALTYDYDSATYAVYFDGVSQGSLVGPQLDTINSTAYVGHCSYYNNDWNFSQGAIDEFRISNCVRYTGNFTPPVSQFSVDEHTINLLHFNE